MAKIRIKVGNKIIEKSVSDKLHLDAQILFPSRKHESKKAYKRGDKYGNKY